MDTLLSKPSATIESLNDVVRAWDDHEHALIDLKDPQGDGAMYQRDRIASAARWACERFTGDLVEIGCLHGSTTVRLAEVARLYKRRVLAVDPFTPGTQNVSADTFAIFTETTRPYLDVIDFMRARSDEPDMLRLIKNRSVALSFIDGLHTETAAYGDLVTMRHASLIVLDDTRSMDGVFNALMRFGDIESERNRECLGRDYWRETYILKGEASNG